MATTDSIYSLGTTADGENLELSLVQLIDGAETLVCATLNQNALPLVWELGIGGYRTPVSAVLNQGGLGFVRYTESTVVLGTTTDGEDLELYFVGALGSHDTPVCSTLCQSGLPLVWELEIGGHRTPLSITLNQGNPTLIRYTDSITALGAAIDGENLELAFVGMFSEYATPVCAALTQSDVLIIWFGIGGHATPVCATYNEFIGNAWAQSMDWAQGMEWVTTEWLTLLIQANYGGFNIQNLGGINNPVNIAGIDD